MTNTALTKKIVRDAYAKIAQTPTGCCGCGCSSNTKAQRQSGKIGYSKDEITTAPQGSNLGLGCGNPTAIASLQAGEVVLDLGCGAGFDAFLASAKVGEKGLVIGVDMTGDMINRARENAKQGGYKNVEFYQGDIEELPLESDSVNVVISNCVINLAPNKEKVFREAYRVLARGGRLMVSDVVLTKPLPPKLKNNHELLVGCVSGAILKQDYLATVKKAGFSKITIHTETPAFLAKYAVSITYSAHKD